MAGGGTPGLGCAGEIAIEALESAAVLEALVAALRDARAVVAGRAAHALKKVQAARPEALYPFARVILRAAGKTAVLEER